MTTAISQRSLSSTYSFSSQPKAIQSKKDESLFRVPENRMGHLMYDRRVIRGVTHANYAKSIDSPQVSLHSKCKATTPLNTVVRINQELLNSLSPDPFVGRLHQPVQTELYLEELTDAIEESDVHCQTDLFLDRAPTPEFVPAKTGEDVATQINEGDLFDFELEVRPLLEVLIGKTVEQSLLEVMEEEQLADLRQQQCIFEQLRQAEHAEVARLMDQDRRLREEKERRKKQHAEAVARETELVNKVNACIFAKSYMNDIVNTVHRRLCERGFYYDPIEKDIEEGFIPWIMNELEGELDLEEQSRLLLDQMIREVVNENYEAYKRLDELTELNQKTQPDATEGLTTESVKDTPKEKSSNETELSSVKE